MYNPIKFNLIQIYRHKRQIEDGAIVDQCLELIKKKYNNKKFKFIYLFILNW